MNISHEKVDAINAVIKVDLAPEDYNPQVDKEIKDQAKKAKLPGFRPGLVPAAHIRRTWRNTSRHEAKPFQSKFPNSQNEYANARGTTPH